MWTRMLYTTCADRGLHAYIESFTGGMRAGTSGLAAPQQGSVNPTFSNYDEIWTWIPIVTEHSGNCQSQINPGQRNIDMTRRNTELVNNLRLPTYSEAVNGNGNVNRPLVSQVRMTSHITSGQQTSRSGAAGHQHLPSFVPSTGTSNNNRDVPVRHGETCVNIPIQGTSTSATSGPSTSQVIFRPTNTSTSRNNTTPDDIPVSRSSLHAHVTNISVTPSSVSALQQARALVEGAGSREPYKPLPSAPSLQQTEPENSRVSSSARPRNQLTSYIAQRTHSPRDSQTANNCVTDVHHAERRQPGVCIQNGPNENRESPVYSGHLRQDSYIMYPHHRRTQNSAGFRHSSGSVFNYFCSNGSRFTVQDITDGVHPSPYTLPEMTSTLVPSSGSLRSRVNITYVSQYQ
ncbi:hypothetical protein MAR_003164 [Mya arenaria]|uniref:Uncharacterized protein n=1 Tax=Mya arenaria TaxID=6604 RepID=A0ABY7G9A5_MYAAR|nr:hypothetical protein MAR_003164 [Mya arenaria]